MHIVSQKYQIESILKQYTPYIFMLKVKPFRQRSGFCGPASLKMVLDYYGKEKSEMDLARFSGCDKNHGVEATGLLKAAHKLGFKGFVKDFAEIKDLRKYVNGKHIPVIVDWFSEIDGHYSVVIAIDKENIYLQDPELGYLRAMTLKTFNRVWFDFPGFTLNSKEDIIIRRMLVIYK